MGCSSWACIKPASGPMFYMAQFFFIYTGFLKDTLFIRLSLLFGITFITLWTLLGVPTWPNFVNAGFPGIQLDALILGIIQLLVNGIPFFIQVSQNDKKVSFDSVTKEEYREYAEAMWRAWFHRSGVSRADFKDILAAGEWVMLQPEEKLPLWSKEDKESGETVLDAFGDTYYYVFGGKVECRAKYAGDYDHSWVSTGGAFVNNLTLQTLFGAAPGALAIQDGPIQATVASDSVVYAVPTENMVPNDDIRLSSFSGMAFHRASKVEKSGALFLRWRRANVISGIVHTGGFAADAFDLMLSQSIMEGLFHSAVNQTSPELGAIYGNLMRARMDDDLAPLPRNIKERKQKKPFLVQWHNSHGWPWHTSPKERAVNSLTCGATELQRQAAITDNVPYLQCISRAIDAEITRSVTDPQRLGSKPSLAKEPAGGLSIDIQSGSRTGRSM
eukprot:CAMPEP_0117678484 /NCGR_PEP_ID=MMETSP0804-20121206/17324_1 /TAXON_ID=1074897 /ORGANISM="Tetraselmis astigmatica, Strain CCMP880" /LENGTH=443 /DNA_ID=CAMNT_0005487879 /DNA_START=543 /DNA_END=1874 /DNA_ORIENTATION=-